MDRDSWKDQALRNIIRAYGSLSVRLFNRLRLLSFRRRALDQAMQYLPDSGDVLDLGCGYGLFAMYFAMALPAIRMRGIDTSQARIEAAREAVRRLAVPDVVFEVGDARELHPAEGIQAVMMIDLVRHLPHDAVKAMLPAVTAGLERGGRLLIKEIEPGPWHKTAYVRLLDKLACSVSPVDCWAPDDLRRLLERLGLYVQTHRMPFSQVLYVAEKPA